VSFVVDNSVALTWCFEDERTPATASLLGEVGELGALAPMLWPLKALNALVVPLPDEPATDALFSASVLGYRSSWTGFEHSKGCSWTSNSLGS